MIELRKVTKNADCLDDLEAINREAIPECERNSLDDMMDTGAEVLGIFLDGSPVGFFALRYYQSICYLAYFAVRRDLRSKGIGSRALRKLIEDNSRFQMVVEYENPDAGGTDDMQARRKAFYLRNGFYETGWYSFYDETDFEIACTAPVFDIEAFTAFTKHLSTFITDHIPKPYRKETKG